MNIQPGSIIHWGDPGEVQFTGKVLTVSGNGKLFVRITFPSNIKPCLLYTSDAADE